MRCLFIPYAVASGAAELVRRIVYLLYGMDVVDIGDVFRPAPRAKTKKEAETGYGARARARARARVGACARARVCGRWCERAATVTLWRTPACGEAVPTPSLPGLN